MAEHNTLISCGSVGVHRLWKDAAKRLGHAIEEKSDETIEKAGTVYMVANYIGGKVLGELGTLLSKKTTLYLYNMKSGAWMVKKGNSLEQMKGRPPRPEGSWIGTGSLAVTPGAKKELESLFEWWK